jgi:hypothetical protein
VLVADDQFLLVTLVDFRGPGNAAEARRTVLQERRALQRTCPQILSPQVTEDNVTTACDRERKIDYTAWNPRRLVRVTLDHSPRSSVSMDDADRLSEQINQRCDELEAKGEA